MRQRADENSITSIALPQIGSGHGGLEVAQVRAAIGQAFEGWTGRSISPCRLGRRTSERSMGRERRDSAPFRPMMVDRCYDDAILMIETICSYSKRS
jgi:hypothetical protein